MEGIIQFRVKSFQTPGMIHGRSGVRQISLSGFFIKLKIQCQSNGSYSGYNDSQIIFFYSIVALIAFGNHSWVLLFRDHLSDGRKADPLRTTDLWH